MTPRRMFVIAFSVVILPLIATLSSCVALTAEDKAQIARDQVTISVCQAKGLMCRAEDAGHCRDVYEECMTGNGMRDAGGE